jgi:hypothetical protein
MIILIIILILIPYSLFLIRHDSMTIRYDYMIILIIILIPYSLFLIPYSLFDIRYDYSYYYSRDDIVRLYSMQCNSM